MPDTRTNAHGESHGESRGESRGNSSRHEEPRPDSAHRDSDDATHGHPRNNDSRDSRETHRDSSPSDHPRDHAPSPEQHQQHQFASREPIDMPRQNAPQEHQQEQRIVAPDSQHNDQNNGQNNGWRDYSRNLSRERNANETQPTQRPEPPTRIPQHERQVESRGYDNRAAYERSYNRSQVFGSSQPARSQPMPTQTSPQANGGDHQRNDSGESRSEHRTQSGRERGRGDRM